MKTNHPESEKGQIMVVFVVALVAFIAFVGLAVDGGMVYVSRQNMQSAADSAAFAGAYARIKKYDNTHIMMAAQSNAITNGYTNGVNGAVVTVDPAYTMYGASDYVKVTITAPVKTSFIHLIYKGISQNTVEAVVHAVAAGSPVFGSDSLIAMNPHACPAMSLNGSDSITVGAGGNIRDNSDCTTGDGAFDARGTPNLTTSGTGRTIVVGDLSHQTHTSDFAPSGSLYTPATQIDYTVAPYVIAKPDCSIAANFPAGTVLTNQGNKSGTLNLTPGNYGNFQGNNSNLTLDPGLYCINNISGNGIHITGAGVLLVVNGSIDLQDTNIQLNVTALGTTAPPPHVLQVTGSTDTFDYAGMVIYSAATSFFNMHGSSLSNITGTVYLPHDSCNFWGSNALNSWNAQIVCDTVALNGSTTLNLNYGGGFTDTEGGTLYRSK